jgi:hypothetical protein
VHNANLLGASLLARLLPYTGDDFMHATLLASLRYSMQHQHRDGGWYYADTAQQRWIDSFHTGFNLQAIRYILNSGIAPEYQNAFNKGVQFYARTFFLGDGTPRYYHTRTYPIDIHAPAQAICFFASEGERYASLTDRVLAWMLCHLYSGNGAFYYRKGRLFTNRIPYMRWAQAWAFHSLTEYLLYRHGGHQYGNSGFAAGRRHGHTRDRIELVSAGH